MLNERFLSKQLLRFFCVPPAPTHVSQEGYCRHQLGLEPNPNQTHPKDERINEAERQNHSYKRSPLLYSTVTEEKHISVTHIHLTC